MSQNKEGKTLTLLIFLLMGFGLLMVSSAGVVESQRRFGSAYYYLFRQFLAGGVVGVFGYFVFSKIPYLVWKKLALPVLLAALLLMLAVFVPSFGLAAKGAIRWLNFGLFSFQPSEVLKLGLIIYFAAWFSGRGKLEKKWSYSLIPFLVILGFSGLLLVLQPDIGTLGIVMLITLAMLFFAGARLSYFGWLGGGLGLGLVLVSFFSSYQANRLLVFFKRSGDPQGVAYHINQALLAIGRGGLWGVGFGQSQQKLSFLPEVVGDSIFAVIVEELGLVGAGLLILLFVLLTLQLVKIARQTTDRFAQLFVLGMAVWIAGQAFINMAAISGLLPLTGIPLPFISYGGTSLAVLLSGLGIVANIAKNA